LYSLTSPKNLSSATKQKLVDLFTDAHCSIMVAPEQFVHVVFFEGIPIMQNKRLYIHANVRLGRSQEQIDKVCEAFTTGCAKILQVQEEDIHINLMEIDGKWAMEGGFVMPSPGEEDEWMEKVTLALAKRESQTA
ncbi:MAG: hypothetical protein AAF388_24720, partial [Bacteroidota bacterium]